MFQNNPIPVTANHTNPLTNICCNPDPYMIFHDGWYYCYSTGYHDVNVLRSKTIENFEHMGFALSVENQLSYWAPAVIFYKGMFYMYYSSNTTCETNPDTEFLKVAVADNPLGPFEYKKTFFKEFTIDADVIVKDDELYLFYCADVHTGDKIGTRIFLDKLLDPFTPEGNPREVIAPSMEQEIYARDRFGDGRDW